LQVSATHLFQKLGVSREEFFEIINHVDPRDHLKFDEKTHETMKKLAEEHELVLLSNSPRQKVDRTLEALKIHEHFTKIYGADDLHDSKPNPEILMQIMDEMGYKPDESFNIGDDLDKEIRIAKEIGMNTVLVKHWPYTEDELAEAHHVVDDIHELPSVLKKFIN
ncbi:HAD family hydrolase, partial [Thermoproteota archaeon]